VPRVIPDEVTVEIDARSWKLPPVFGWLGRQGGIATGEMARVFNCGIGMVVIVAAERADDATRLLQDGGETVYRLGSVTPRAGRDGCIVSNMDSWG
jgi:phosphoribosylformylglycinamidine cyclo-ligase